jgi:glycosyltransferase involved in cell wall biosynthesis
VLYHGGLFEERGVEQLLEAIPDVPKAVLVLMGYGSLVPTIQRRLTEPALAGRAFLLPPVPPAELPNWVASADVVAIPIQPTTLNHRFATPNKLWEAMAAGVPILAGDLPGMAGYIRETDGGVLVDPTEPASIARGLRELLAQPADARRAMHDRLVAAARDRYCWEVQEPTYLGLLGRLTGKPW